MQVKGREGDRVVGRGRDGVARQAETPKGGRVSCRGGVTGRKQGRQYEVVGRGRSSVTDREKGSQ